MMAIARKGTMPRIKIPFLLILSIMICFLMFVLDLSGGEYKTFFKKAQEFLMKMDVIL